MHKRWVEKETDLEMTDALQASLQIDHRLAAILTQRVVTTFEEARSVFRPDLNHLHHPFLMKDMDKAVARIEKAMASDEKMLIYGDYDVAGTT